MQGSLFLTRAGLAGPLRSCRDGVAMLLGSTNNAFWLAGGLHGLGDPSHRGHRLSSDAQALSRGSGSPPDHPTTEWVLSLGSQAPLLPPGGPQSRGRHQHS